MIETERLLLREYTPEDFDALHEILSDPETMAHYPAPFDEARVRRWIDWNLENYAQHGFGLWAAVLKETGEFIGDCGLTLQNIDGEMLPEIGYHIHKKYWRQGLAREAARAVRDWAFRNTDYDILYSYMKYTNEASWRTAMAIGMKKIKEYSDPKNTLSCAFAITREEWAVLLARGGNPPADMRVLFEFDYKNYRENGTVGRRVSARGIIIKAGRLAMVHSEKYDYYTFPGGGINPGETMEDALIREIREETSLAVLRESIRPYGRIIRREKGAIDDLFIQESAYYLCGVSDQPLCPRLSGCEVDEAFALCWIDPETAIAANRQHPHGALSGQEWAAHLFQRDELLIRKLQEERLL